MAGRGRKPGQQLEGTLEDSMRIKIEFTDKDNPMTEQELKRAFVELVYATPRFMPVDTIRAMLDKALRETGAEE